MAKSCGGSMESLDEEARAAEMAALEVDVVDVLVEHFGDQSTWTEELEGDIMALLSSMPLDKAPAEIMGILQDALEAPSSDDDNVAFRAVFHEALRVAKTRRSC